jgi:ribosomal protein S18 acetylase RimI-like enzyme
VEAARIRTAQERDYDRIIVRVDEWWGGRELSVLLPRLFLDHFRTTSAVAESADGSLVGFLVGFLSPSRPDEAYVHFVAVAPGERGHGLGRCLHDWFADLARRDGRTTVRCVTSPVNEASVAFHRALGFEVGAVVRDYDGPGRDRVPMARRLGR